MKQLFTLIFIALMFVCKGQINHNEINISDTKEIKGLFYLKTDTTLVTGRVIRYNKKGKVQKYVFVKNGVPDNLGWIHYNNDYKSPKESGLGSLVSGVAIATGAVMEISGNDIDIPLPINNTNKSKNPIIQNDVKDMLDYNKEIAATAHDDMSQRNEILKNIQLNEESDLIEKLSDGLYQKKHENGQLLIEGSYIDGERDGEWKAYYSNGILESKGNYNKGTKKGLWQEYYESGQLKRKVNYSKGNIDGLWEQYHPNSQLWAKGFYKFGHMIGEWRYYDEDGKLLLKENYEN
ncbi:toxin-antitoxin system YwqK family antitoxin [Seonamhaeicola maritimus]|uniref:Toxin-antitoxin system YwqK family antitoxin n=1 Tax=Seonamhaeicola maritimus TaxID=2591822 RepID=A0A5C7GHF7_9FLAO|nr:toxin-antitoxin system YwqK family antitoxin [Seonamhaeicola maritimus]TXG37028.1 toxin-antitoxin system YwqK family antitoxin [Seonamhaeicola maritimus]